MREVRYSIPEACKKIPAVNTTVKLAERMGMKITAHCAQLNKRGAIAVHWLWDGKEWRRNQRLLSWLRVCKEGIERQGKSLKDYVSANS